MSNPTQNEVQSSQSSRPRSFRSPGFYLALVAIVVFVVYAGLTGKLDHLKPKRFVGKWEVVGLNAGPLEFRRDGTFTLHLKGEPRAGTYILEESKGQDYRLLLSFAGQDSYGFAHVEKTEMTLSVSPLTKAKGESGSLPSILALGLGWGSQLTMSGGGRGFTLGLHEVKCRQK